MSNYLKKILFTLLIFVTPYMNSVTMAAGDDDYEGSNIRVRKVAFVTEDQQDVSSSIKQSTSSPVVSLEDCKVSWASYLMSPVKSMVKNAYDIVDYTTRNPQKAMVIGLCLATQFSGVAANCACYCFNNGPKFYGECVTDMTWCEHSCSILGFPAAYCMVNNKGC